MPIHHDDDTRRPGGGTDVLDRTSTKPKLEKPPLYKVLLHNDDYTPFELVMHVLQSVFMMSPEKAFQVMLTAHETGLCLCGVFQRDVADTLVQKAREMAKAQDFALQFTMEKE